MFTDISIVGFDPVLFYTNLLESNLGEKIQTFAVIIEDIAVKLMQKKCVEAIINETFQCH